MEETRAAGGVIVRSSPEGAVEVVVVHRPRYDDWTIPKGKVDPGETLEEAALREVREETGIVGRLGRYLGESRYPGPDGEPKVVHYWVVHPEETPPFEPNEEVDELRWLPVPEARELLTHLRDRELVGLVLRS
ncbi:MAG TPA: NUDIX hydrolase [Actinomycetota bacterium]|nr:NUDIX hydrolase [Actinomycetota bacterium]